MGPRRKSGKPRLPEGLQVRLWRGVRSDQADGQGGARMGTCRAGGQAPVPKRWAWFVCDQGRGIFLGIKWFFVCFHLWRKSLFCNLVMILLLFLDQDLSLSYSSFLFAFLLLFSITTILCIKHKISGLIYFYLLEKNALLGLIYLEVKYFSKLFPSFTVTHFLC